jgi:hypothetical protein
MNTSFVCHLDDPQKMSGKPASAGSTSRRTGGWFAELFQSGYAGVEFQ